jgi:hypothetical protein
VHHITPISTVSTALAKKLKVLHERIEAANIPSSKLDETFNLASWNIREFGKVARTQDAIHFVAEILGQFDVISVVELRDDLTDLARVLQVLGPYWKAVYSDAVLDPGGNRESRVRLRQTHAHLQRNGISRVRGSHQKENGVGA